MIDVIRLDNGTAVLDAGDMRLTAATAPRFKEEILGIVEGGSHRLILDLKGVNFIDSTGLGALVGILKRLGPRGDLALCGLQRSVATMFTLTRMDRIFRIYPDVAAASAAFEQV
jgi:anti-sigma B factor antagonist